MIALALPVVVACLATTSVVLLYRLTTPQVAVLVLAATAAATAVAVTGLLLVVALVLLFDPHSAAWCEQFLGHGSHRALVPGLIVGGVAIAFALRGVRSLIRMRAMLVTRAVPAERVDILPTARHIAYAQPGRPGRVVVSQGMLDALTGEEQLVLFAHERAHLRRQHHRYIAIADAAADVIPLLRPLAASVRFECERWADEDAASVVGERKLVAKAVAVAALAEADARALAFGGATSGVPARVEALLQPPVGRWRPATLFVAGPALVAVAAAALQAQRLGEVIRLVV